MTESDFTDLDVGVERTNACPTDADWYAYVDEGERGEYAVVWAVTREDDHNVTVATWYVNAGLFDPESDDLRHFSVDPDEATGEWAQQYAENHRDAIDLARSHFEEETDD